MQEKTKATQSRYAPDVAEAKENETRSRKLVVAGLVIDGSRVLITKRRADQPLPNKWEFPGGKMEPSETPEAALVRELEEEIGVEVRVGVIWEVLSHAYPSFD